MTRLTWREKQILVEAANGRSASMTAARFFIGYQTVRTHRANVIRKLKARNMTEAVAIATRSGILLPEDVA
jgi:DNA-binding CsgD family transcriptional regulator